MKTVQLTREGFDSLKQELDELVNVKRPKAIDTLQKARAMGDLSENTAYTAARDEQALVEGRIQEIEEIMKNAQVIESGNNADTVALGSVITVEVNGIREIFQIVGEFEADPLKKKLSHSSPLGKGLLDKKIGETVEVKVPAGKVLYKIISIK